MKQFTNRLASLLSQPWSRLQRRFQTANPGSVLIMVVALIVLLALMGTAYVGSARMERFASVATTNQRALRDATDSYARQLLDQVKALIVTDANSGNLVTAPSDAQTTTQVLAARAPGLLPDLVKEGPSTQHPPTPVWPVISRFAGRKFESPWNLAVDGGTLEYQPGSNVYFAPTNIVIHYPIASASNSSRVDPILFGQTRTFPAFQRYAPLIPAVSLETYVDDGPYLAADATGAGVADSALVRLSTSSIQGVEFYGAIRVIDNSSAFNVNTAWGRAIDLDDNGNCYNFVPSDLDLLGAMNATTSNGAPTEMIGLNKRRFSGPALSGIKKDDAGMDHPDVRYLNAADEFWNGLGRRPDYPNGWDKMGDKTGNVFERPYSWSDTAALAYHGGLLNLENPLSKLDLNLSTIKDKTQAGADSIYASAANAVVNPQNRFSSFAANNVGYWYDWYWNFDGVTTPAGAKIQFPLTKTGSPNPFGLSVSGRPFYPLRGLTVANNPVANLCKVVDYASIPGSAKSPAVPSAEALPLPNIVHPVKASLNTADFPELWQAYINIMAGSAQVVPVAGKLPFTVPFDNPITPAPATENGGMFRNVLRHPLAGTTKSTIFVSPINRAPQRLDSSNVLLLRAASAAVNAMTLREGHGYNPNGSSYFIPDPVRRAISLRTVAGKDVQALVYGVTANPYITEIYANTDQSDHGGKKNDGGFVAVKLYNPYPFDIDLNDYQFAIVDRRSTAVTLPNMNVTMLNPFKITAGKNMIPGKGTYLLTNYSGKAAGAGLADTFYWPLGSGLLDMPATEAWTVPDLYKVFGLGPAGEVGGELVLLRTLHHGDTKPEVPVDSYDFTGLSLTAGNPALPVQGWHYCRTVGTTTVASRWKFIYPGTYDATDGNKGLPRMEGTETESWKPADPEPWEITAGAFSVAGKKSLINTDTTSVYPNNFPGIELCNVDFGGFHKYKDGTKRVFPFGGFARVGDFIQAPFIGSYVLFEKNPQTLAGKDIANVLPKLVMEINPVTMDTCMADDGDATDDKFEQIGRFSPIEDNANNINDYAPLGTGFYRVDQTPAIPGDLPIHSKWRYRFAIGAVDQFTTVSNPDSDYFPNFNPLAWKGVPGEILVPVPNSQGAVKTPNKNEFATEGLLNINTASWRMLAAIEMIPLSQDNPAGDLNVQLAKLIVRYRDVDDGIKRIKGGITFPPQGHGAFNSLMELNKVFDPTDATRKKTFQNALGNLPSIRDPADPSYYNWGNYAPGPEFLPVKAGQKVDNASQNDWLPNTLMVTRISNLVTTRSDSFTAYVIIQGWRNARTQFPELVVQRRLALLIDRSALGLASGSPKVYTVPTD